MADPLDPATALGPMASRHHLHRVREYTDIGCASGARLVTGGGGRPAGPWRGAVGGAINCTSSAARPCGQAHYAHHVGAEHAVVGPVWAFANEPGNTRMRVSPVHPTGISNAGRGQASGVAEAHHGSRFFPAAALNVLPDLDTPPGTPFMPAPKVSGQEISNAVMFLSSNEGHYITGVQIPVMRGNPSRPDRAVSATRPVPRGT